MAGDRILITGATGFLGRQVAVELFRRGHALTLVCRQTDRVATELRESAAVRLLAEPDLASGISEDAFADVGRVVHLAGLAHVAKSDRADMAAKFETVNVTGTRHLIEAAKGAGVASFVFVSSIGALCGNTSPEIIDDRRAPAPMTDYGRSKLAADTLVADLVKAGVFAISLRPPLIVGAEARGNWRSLQRLAATGLPLPFASLTNHRSYVSATMLSEAIGHVLEHDWPASRSGAYVIADPRPVTLVEALTALREGMEIAPRLFGCPPQLYSILGAMLGRRRQLAGLTGRLVVDPSRFMTDFGFEPSVGIIEAMRRSGRAFCSR